MVSGILVSDFYSDCPYYFHRKIQRNNIYDVVLSPKFFPHVLF